MRKFATKKVLAASLAAAMTLSMVGCGGKDENADPTPAPTGSAGSETPDTGDDGDKGNAGADVTKAPDEGNETPELNVETFEGEYVYKDSVSTLAANWNPHDYEVNDDRYPLDYTTSGLYEFIYNDELNPVEGKDPYEGYLIRPEMAAELPVDVTAEVKAAHPEFNIPESAEEGYAYRIKLNEKATWADGTPINADTYIYSMRALMDPIMKNYRASDYMDGDFVVANAREYYYQGQSSFIALGQTTGDYLANGGSVEDLYVDVASFYAIVAPDGSNYGKATDDTKVRDEAVAEGEAGDWVSTKEIYDTYFAPGAPYESMSPQYVGTMVNYEANYPVENLGIFKNSDYEFTLVLGKSLAGFNLLYNLSGNWIVYEDLYEAGKSQIGETDAWTTNYNTSVETSMSYGPYKLVEFQSDKHMRFEKNENWYGYTDGKHIYQDPEDGLIYPMYQTTAIDCQVVADAATHKLMFLKGQLMGYGLQSEDFTEYRDSDYCYVTPDETIYFFIFNGYMDAIKEREASADFDQTKFDLETLTLKSFRQAVAVTYDKEALCTAVSPARSGGYGLIGNNYIYDPETGAKYRDTDQAKKALCAFYSVDTSKYASLDDAVASITGYDEVAAKKLYTDAYNEAIELGYITDTDGDGKSDQTIEIIYASSATSDFIQKTLDYLNKKMAEVLVGTPFEGKIYFKESAPLGTAWSDTIKAGLADTVLGGWGGSALNPFSLSDLYTNPAKQFDGKWFDSSSESFSLDVNVAGLDETPVIENVTLSLKQWSDALNGATVEVNGKSYNFGDGIADVNTRLDILAQIEYTVLMTYDYIPMLQNAGMSLLSQQVYYVIEDYNPILGRGGIAYMKYNYDETAWEAYIAEQGGQLTY